MDAIPANRVSNSVLVVEEETTLKRGSSFDDLAAPRAATNVAPFHETIDRAGSGFYVSIGESVARRTSAFYQRVRDLR